MEKDVEIGIFGGTGIYDSGLLENAQEVDIDTPYGKPSDTITVGTFKGRKIAFLPRHGKKHTIPPHMINFKANIWAFKELGVTRIIAPSAVGSLKEELEPGHFALPIDTSRACGPCSTSCRARASTRSDPRYAAG
jgi:5'-methylthioadenosine phosphorylase